MTTAVQKQALKTLMDTLLRSSAAQKIDFYLDRFHVDAAGLTSVAQALQRPKRAHGLDVDVAHLPADRDAQYNTASNTFIFPSATYGTTPYQRASIIHESVHALRDSKGRLIHTSLGLTSTRALSDEAAAYVAGALFHIYDTTTPVLQALLGTTGPATPSWAQGTSDLLSVAHRIAVKMSTQQGYAVTPQDAKALRDAILNDPTYKFIKHDPRVTRYGNNGI